MVMDDNYEIAKVATAATDGRVPGGVDMECTLIPDALGPSECFAGSKGFSRKTKYSRPQFFGDPPSVKLSKGGGETKGLQLFACIFAFLNDLSLGK